MLNIAVDFDRTYSADPATWLHIMRYLHSQGHNPFIVTARNQDLDGNDYLDAIAQTGFDIYWCDGVAKRWCLANHYDVKVDIWIDDKPENILYNSAYTPEEVKEWRATREF